MYDPAPVMFAPVPGYVAPVDVVPPDPQDSEVSVPYPPWQMVTPCTMGVGLTVIALVTPVHPVVPSVKVKVAFPVETPVTTPALLTVATDGLLLVHVPPDEGDKKVLEPTQIEVLPVMVTEGSAIKVIVP